MDTLTFIGIIVLALVLIIGTVVKLYTRNKLKDLEGTYDIKDKTAAQIKTNKQ